MLLDSLRICWTYFLVVHPFVSLSQRQRPLEQRRRLERLPPAIAFVDGIVLDRILWCMPMGIFCERHRPDCGQPLDPSSNFARILNDRLSIAATHRLRHANPIARLCQCEDERVHSARCDAHCWVRPNRNDFRPMDRHSRRWLHLVCSMALWMFRRLVCPTQSRRQSTSIRVLVDVIVDAFVQLHRYWLPDVHVALTDEIINWVIN